MTFYNYTFDKLISGGKINNDKYEKIGDLKLSVGEVFKYTLDNGIRLVEIPMNSNLFAAGIYVNIGSRDEEDEHCYGIAHFLEHMIFKGTTTKTSKQIDIMLDNLGAIYNASTSMDYTSYYLTGNPNDSYELLDLLLDLYCNPTFPEEDIINERKVVLEEWRMNTDNNKRKLIETILRDCYDDIDDDSFKRSIIGNEKTIKNFSRNDIIKFRKKYTHQKTIIVLAGHYDKKKIFNLIKNYFNCNIKKTVIPGYKEKIENKIIIKNDYKKPQIVKIKKNSNQTIICLCFKTINRYSKYINTINIISDILTSGFSSKLFDLLRNKLGVSYSCESYYLGQKETGLFIIELGLENTVITNTLKNILLILKEICLYGITKNELNIVKKKNETELLFDFKEPMEYIDHYGHTELYKKTYKNIIDMYNNIQNETIDNVKLLCNKMFKKKNLILGIIGNPKISIMNNIKKIINNDELYY